MRRRWGSVMALMVKRLVFPPRCRVCGELLPWGVSDGAASDGDDNLVAYFHGVFSPVMCAACRGGVEVPSGQRCSACGVPLLGEVPEPLLCGACMDSNRPLSRVTAVFLHDGGPALAVRALKYRNKRALAPPMGRLLFARALSAHLDAEEKRWDIDLVVPVPLHAKRLRHRGFNQASLLLSAFEKEPQLSVRHRLMRRKKATKSQAGLTRKARLKNVKGAFGLRRPAEVKGKRVLLVDDVFTTGSTVAACAAVLKKNGAAEVSALVFSRRDMTSG